MILTCGPTEFADAFKENAAFSGFDLYLEAVETIAANEANEIEAWYHQRTGKISQRGAAFSQATQEDNGLFVSLAVELTHGDLQAFAHRFGERVRLNGLDNALRLPLALNRLYLRAPYNWLSDHDREHLATLNGEGDFCLLEADMDGQIVRLTHPHLADAIYRALRAPSNSESYTNDLVAAFKRALAERDAVLVQQLIRTFSARGDGLTSERTSILDCPRLARECAEAWAGGYTQLALNADGLADVATSWACWAMSADSISEVLGADLLGKALAHLGQAYKVWPGCWPRLAEYYPGRGDLFNWAAENLTDPKKKSHPTWSYVWEYCLRNDPARRVWWRDMGLDWLRAHFHRPDWHIVWKHLLPAGGALDWKTDPALILGQQRLYEKLDGPDWAYVFEDLYALVTPRNQQADDLTVLARTWLAGREDRAEWAHVWQDILARAGELPDVMPLAELLLLGAGWLAGREDTEEWGFVCEALLERQYRTQDFLDRAADGFVHTLAAPAGQLLAVKFIVVAPQHAASTIFAHELAQRIRACPNSGIWFKMDKLVRDLAAEIKLPPAVRDWLQALLARKEAPAWAEARRCLDEVLPVKGRVTTNTGKSWLVELEIGLMAVWSNGHAGVGPFQGLEHSFFVQQMNPDKGKIQVGIEKPFALEVGGTYEGVVTSVLDYGIFLRIDTHCGLLHRSQLPPRLNDLRHYAEGQTLSVKVIKIKADGKLSLALPVP
jgi:hypothetical protein